MKSSKLQLKTRPVSRWHTGIYGVKNWPGKRLLLLLAILALELAFVGARSFLSSGFTVFGQTGQVFGDATGNFLFQTLNSDAFIALFGDRFNPAGHLWRFEREGTAIELSLQGDPLEDSVLGESSTSSPSARILTLQEEAAKLAQEGAIATDSGQALEEIQSQLEEITSDLESISTGLEAIETQSAQIGGEVQSLVGQTTLETDGGQEVVVTSEALPGVDISHQLLDEGIRQNIIFKTISLSSSLSFTLSLDGLTPSQGQDGRWDLLNSSGRPIATFTPPLLSDASGAQANPPPIEITQVGGQTVLGIPLNQAWLSSPDRVYPISLEQDLLAVVLGLSPAKDAFTALEELVFDFEYWPDDGPVPQETLSATLLTLGGQVIPAGAQIEKVREGKYRLRFPPPRSLKAGRHKIELSYEQGGQTLTTEQDFSWGVLAVNVNKSIYLPGEEAYLQMAVLDDGGRTVCDADIKLKVKSPKLKVDELSTEDGSIQQSPECGPTTVTYTPDYFAYYQVGEPGVYEMKLTAETAGGSHSISDSFEVRETVPFDIERYGPTRIYPPENYRMKITVKANQDFSGEIREEVPASFAIIPQDGLSVTLGQNTKVLSWQADLASGETKTLSYEFDAPDISPAFYLLGPLEIKSEILNSTRLPDGQESETNSNVLNSNDQNKGVAFREARRWQIAADDIGLENSNSTSFTSATNPTFTLTVTSATLLIVQVVTQNATTITVSDDAGNTYSSIHSVTNSDRLEVFYVNQPNGGSPITITINGTSISGAAGAFGLTGTDTTTPYDTGSLATCTGTGKDQTCDISADANNWIISSAFSDGVATTYTHDASQTEIWDTIWSAGSDKGTGTGTYEAATGGTDTQSHTAAAGNPAYGISNVEVNAGPTGPTNDQLLRHGDWFSSGVEQPYTF